MTIAVGQLIDSLERSGIRVWAEDGQLRFRAPQGAMTEERRSQIRERKEEILEHLHAGGFPRLTPDPVARHEVFPITDVQSAYLLGRGRTFVYGGVACHGYGELRYPGLDPARMTAAWRALIARHDMLRAVVAADGSQRVLPEVPDYEIAVTDCRGRGDFAAAVEETRARMDHRVFAHDRWPLFEARITLGDGEAVLHVSVDFLIADFVSIQIILDELHRFYDDPELRLPALDITFRDYLLAEKRWVAGGRHDTDRDYWLGRVDALPAGPDLPITSSAAQSPGRFRRWATTLDTATWAALKTRAGQHNVSPSTAVLAAYTDVIAAWSRRPAFTVNVTLLNRLPLHRQVPKLIGDFTSVELLAVDASAPVFAERARAVQAQLWQDMDHRTFTGIEVMREITRRKGGDAAIFPVVFTSAIGLVAEEDSQPPFFGELGYGISQTPQVFIDCQNMERGGELATNWDVRDGVFPDGLIDDMFAAYTELLRRLAADDQAWAAGRGVALPAEQMRRRAEVNDTAAPLPPGRLHDKVFEQARLTPHRVAVISGGQEITYQRLAEHAFGVAAALAEAGCGEGDLVAVSMRRGWRQISAALGTLLTGAAYVPVDVSSPPARQAQILQSSGTRFRLTEADLMDTLAQGPATIAADLVQGTQGGAVGGSTPDSLAYVIHTSGSTGTPKGVMISHTAALNTVADINSRFDVTADDRVLALSALGFDLSVYDIFGPLAVGGCLVIPDHERRADPSHWADLVARHRVTIWNSVPAQLQMLAGYLATPGAPGLPSLRLAMMSGDWIPVALPDQIRSHLAGLEVVSLGGATEASIWSIHYPIGTVSPAWASIPYGKPLANQTFHVLDAALNPCPDWVAGELYIGGAGLAMGYLNDPERTGERFITHPATGQRLYRTGDLGRYLPDGNIEFLGREDFQVKIRGYRIELAEIETALCAHPGVAAATVLVEGDTPLERRLAAFVEPARAAAAHRGLDVLADAACAVADRAIEGVDQRRYRTFTDRLDGVALPGMVRALRAGGLFGHGQTHSLEEILATAQVSTRHHRLVRRWLGALTAEGVLALEDGRYRLVREVALEPAWAQVDEVAVAEDSALLDYFRNSIAALPELLRGDTDPLRLLFPDGRLDVSQTLYEDALFNRWANEAAAEAVRRLAQRHGRPRVLEVGAGGGGTTGYVLKALQGTEFDYLATDLSPYFVNQAQTRFADVAGIRFGTFDLNADALAQGLGPNSFDIIIAGDVLHATADVDRALARLRGLLAPGGSLVLLEMTRDHYQIMTSLELLVSLDEATHDFADGRRGTDAVFLTREQWRAALSAAQADSQVCLPAEGTFVADMGMCVFVAGFKGDRARLDPAGLTEHLRRRLPEHMIPPALHVLDALPVTDNAKIDRRALLAQIPRQATAVRADSGDMNELEAQIAAMWTDALNVPVDKHGNLFQLGGDSLVAAQLAGRIMEEVPQARNVFFDEVLRNLLERPTVAGLAEWLATAQPQAVTRARPEADDDLLVVLREAGTTAPLVLLPDVTCEEDVPSLLGRVAEAIDPKAGAYALRGQAFTRLPNLDALVRDCVQALIAADLPQLRLVANGLSCLPAVEIARSLTERGILVEEVVLLAPAKPARTEPVFEPVAGTPGALRAAVAAAQPAIYAGDLVLIWPEGGDPAELEFWEDLCLGDFHCVPTELDGDRLRWPSSVVDVEVVAGAARQRS